MTAARPYGEPRPVDEAVEEVRACRGSQFCPTTVDHFLALLAAGVRT